MSTSTKQKPTPVVPETEDEFFETLDGYEEQAVQSMFAARVEALPLITGRRALIAVHHLRQSGAKTTDANARQEAKKAAMALSIRKTVDYFAQPPEDDGDESGAGETADETTEAGDPVGEAEAPAPDVQHE